jgi:hypothetical protein
MGTVSFLLALLQAIPATTPAGDETPRPVILEKTEAPGTTVFYLSLPWGPKTFEAMERPGEGPESQRTWPFGRLETEKPLSLEGTRIPPGNYALLFHPNDSTNQGTSFELRRVPAGEFLKEGTTETPVPEGETIWREPVRFDTAAGTSPNLRIQLMPGKHGFQMRVQYGDRWTTREFSY